MIRYNPAQTVIACDQPGCNELVVLVGIPWETVFSKIMHAHGWARRKGLWYCDLHKWKKARAVQTTT